MVGLFFTVKRLVAEVAHSKIKFHFCACFFLARGSTQVMVLRFVNIADCFHFYLVSTDLSNLLLYFLNYRDLNNKYLDPRYPQCQLGIGICSFTISICIPELQYSIYTNNRMHFCKASLS